MSNDQQQSRPLNSDNLDRMVNQHHGKYNRRQSPTIDSYNREISNDRLNHHNDGYQSTISGNNTSEVQIGNSISMEQNEPIDIPTTFALLPSLAALATYPMFNWCAKCNASFRLTSDLVHHMRTHHGRQHDD